jgi:hypothetical protein
MKCGNNISAKANQAESGEKLASENQWRISAKAIISSNIWRKRGNIGMASVCVNLIMAASNRGCKRG